MRYGSDRYKGRLHDHFVTIEGDETNPLDLVPELQVQRVMLSMALDRLDTSPKQPQARRDGVVAESKEVGRESDDVDNKLDVMGVDGGGVGLMVDMVPVDIPRAQFSPSNPPVSSDKPYMRLVRTEDIELVRELAGDIVNTVAKVVAMRNQTALTKAEITYLFATMKEAIGMFVAKENQEAFIRYIMDKIPIGEKAEESV
jgi:hypothetical protein